VCSLLHASLSSPSSLPVYNYWLTNAYTFINYYTNYVLLNNYIELVVVCVCVRAFILYRDGVQSTRGGAAGSTRAGQFRELKTSSRGVLGTEFPEGPPPVLV